MPNTRLTLIVDDLESLLLGFLRKHRITHDEYRLATQLLIDTVKAGEASLLYDVFLEAEATAIGSEGCSGTPEALEGPFYLAGAPLLAAPFSLPQRADEAGDPLLFHGRVLGTDGRPLAQAELDVWQADAQGVYSNIHPGVPAWNLRGRLFTDAQGRFELRSIVPPPYEIPKDGPTGQLLRGIGRHFFRPAHLHVKLRHAGHAELTTQLYFEGDPYLASDVAKGVRDGLVLPLEKTGQGYALFHEFQLAPADSDGTSTTPTDALQAA